MKSKFLVVLFSLFFLSCISTKNSVAKHNYFNEDYFYNDTLKLGINFWGALNFSKINRLDKKDFKNIKKHNSSLNSNNLFLVSNSRINNYSMYFFYDFIQNENNTKPSQKIVYHDTINKFSLIENIKENLKISTYIKADELNKNYSLSIANDLIARIHIDSIDNEKLSIYKIWGNYAIKKRNSLQAREKIMKAPINDKGFNGLKFQFSATINSLISNNYCYDTLITNYEMKRKIVTNELYNKIKDSLDIKKNQDVFDGIGEFAKNNSVIMLNEDHYYPKHRILGLKLLDILKENGYTNLSLEAFNPNDTYKIIPNYNNGFYTSEPYFAHFIRKAIDLGFIVTGHENTDSTIDREIGQAKNIYKIIEQNPKAKVFVYVGHSHIEKGENEKKWMAEYFKEISKINPITINQVSLVGIGLENLILIPKKYLTENSNIRSNADYFIINDIKTRLEEIYPNKIFRDYTLTIDFKKEKEVLVSVYDFKEYSEIKNAAIPLINTLESNPKNKIKIKLPIGEYQIKIMTVDNVELFNKAVDVR